VIWILGECSQLGGLGGGLGIGFWVVRRSEDSEALPNSLVGLGMLAIL
jgi:hypothetical protein